MALTEIPIELSSTPGIVDNSNSTAITIDSSENVGIGSATANHFSTAGATNILGVKGTSGGLISIAATGTNFSGIDVGTDTTRRGGIYSLDGSHLAFYTNAANSGGSLTERMRINSSGNVGINTTNPAQRFVVAEGTNQHGIELAPGTLSYIQAYDRATADYGDLKIDAQTIQFGTDNGTERMRIDSSGNVGIGGTPATARLEVTGAFAYASGANSLATTVSKASARIRGSSDASTSLFFGSLTNDAEQYIQSSNGAGDAADDLVLNPYGGNVGIGTSSPTSPLTVTKDAGGIATFTGISSGGVSSVLMKQSRGSIASPSNSATAGDGNYILGQVYNSGYATIGSIGIITGSALNNGEIQFNTASSGTVAERMRILADGSVCQSNTVSLVASNYNNQAGAAWHEPDGHYEIATTSNVAPLEIGKNNATDGSLVVFRKQSTVVGSIGTEGGDLTIGVGTNCGLQFNDGNAAIRPFNMAGNAPVDNAVSLGISTQRFKDLYLSGGAYLGGTAAANKLDDYEEGTWTPVLAAHSGTSPTISGTNYGFYTKVGRLVSVIVELNVTSISGTTSNYITCSLPISAAVGAGYFSQGSQTNSSVAWARPENVGPTLYDSSKFGFLTSDNAGGGWGWEAFGAFSGNEIMRISFSYYAT